MRILFIFFSFTSITFADQGLKISCLNMLTAIGEKYEHENYSLDSVEFQYFDKKMNVLRKIKTKDLEIGDDYFTARLTNYHLTFQNMLFKDDNKERMVMSKYDYINDKFLDHYFCDYSVENID